MGSNAVGLDAVSFDVRTREEFPTWALCQWDTAPGPNPGYRSNQNLALNSATVAAAYAIGYQAVTGMVSSSSGERSPLPYSKPMLVPMAPNWSLWPLIGRGPFDEIDPGIARRYPQDSPRPIPHHFTQGFR